MKVFHTILALICTSAVFAGIQINIDACSYGPVHSGAAVIGEAMDVWNQVAPGTTADLLDSNGNLTGVSFITNYTNQYSNGGANADASIKPLVQDYFYRNSKATITLSGLAANSAFTLYIYAGEAGTDGRGGEWSIDTNGDGLGNAPLVVVTAAYSASQIPAAASMTTPADYALLTGTVKSDGTIDIIGYPVSGWVNFMGLQIEAEISKPYAYSPIPLDGETNVDPAIVSSVSWVQPQDPNIVSIVGYDIYWSDDYPLPTTPTVAYTVQGDSLSFTPSPAITYDSTYYWRIDTHSLNPQGDPNLFVGNTWEFSTLPAVTVPVVSAFTNAVTAVDMTASLSAVVSGNTNPITDVLFEVDELDPDYPAGAVYSLVDTTVVNENPTATFVTDTPGTYKIDLTVTDDLEQSVSASAQIDVYADACDAKKNAPSSWNRNYYDVNSDCVVDLLDYVQMAAQWQSDTSLTESQKYQTEVIYVPISGGTIFVEAEDLDKIINCTTPPITDNNGPRIENKSAASGGKAIGYATATTFITYAVNIPAGTYTTIATVGNSRDNYKALFGTSAGNNSYGEVQLKYVGGNSTFVEFTGTITIPTDITSITISWSGGGFGFDCFTLIPQ